MGSYIENFFKWWLGMAEAEKLEKRVLMMGLDKSGKTTILYKLKLGEVIVSIPTVDK